MIAERTYQHPNNPGLDVKFQNRLHTQSMRLLKLISESFLPEPFILEDVKESFNAPGFVRSSPSVKLTRFGESHLGYLVSVGALDYNSGTKSYSVNPNSRYVGSLVA